MKLIIIFATEIGIFVMSITWIVLGYFCVRSFYGKSKFLPLYCQIFYFWTNKISLVLFLATFWIFFVELCILAVLCTKSVKGQKKA
jgi:hypothetical protein